MSLSTDQTGSTPLGDPLPRHVVAYYTELDGGRPDEAADTFTDDAIYAVPVAGAETDPRVVTTGRGAIRARLRARGAVNRLHHVQLCVVEGPTCLVEGVVRNGDGRCDTFVASLTVGNDGIERYLAYACSGMRDPIPTSVSIDSTPAVARDMLDAYFGAMDEGDFEAAAGCFADDVLYSHPPYRHTDNDSDDRVEFRSRAELLAAFHSRGRQSFGHRIIRCVQRGPHALIEGVVFDLPHGGTGSFISSLSLDDAGLIRRYLSFYCEPSVPER